MSAATPPRSLFYYGWVNVIMGSLAMTATLPGRTHGLGLITQPLLADLDLSEQEFSQLNFGAVLLGALMAWPVGRMIDRWGTRPVGSLILFALGATVIGMSQTTSAMLFPYLLIVRGLGQGALSIVSIAMVGKWFGRRLGPAMGVFSVLLALGFIASTVATGEAVQTIGWRPAWQYVGFAILALAPLTLRLVRSKPDPPHQQIEETLHLDTNAASPTDATLGQALRSPAFWAYSLASALFGLVWSAITLYSESILNDHKFGPQTFIMVMAILAGFGLVCNLLGGWLAMSWPLGRLLGISMALLALALGAFPWVQSEAQVIAYALALGGSGGLITVVFFTFYGQAFGRTHLGLIQGSAHILSVFASALGPVLLIWSKTATGSYNSFFLIAAPHIALLGLAGWLIPMPRVLNRGSHESDNDDLFADGLPPRGPNGRG